MANDSSGFNPTPKLDYVTASQGKIFLDGVLIDEAYDIQYTYQESKEPIYGYNSKHFDAIVDGNVIVYGNFTINYKHDAYLHSILTKVKDITSIDEAKDKRTINMNLGNMFAGKIKAYRSKQSSITDAKKSLKLLQSKELQLEGDFILEKNRLELNILNAEARVNNSRKAIDAFWNGKDAYEQEFIVKKIAEFNDKAIGKGGAWEEYHSVNSVKEKMSENLLATDDDITFINGDVSRLGDQIFDQEELIGKLEDKLSTINRGSDPDNYNDISYEIDEEKLKLADLNNELISLQSQISSIEETRDSKQEIYNQALQQREEELVQLKNASPELAEALSLDLDHERALAEQEIVTKDSFISEIDKELESVDQEITTTESNIKSLEQELSDIKDGLANIKELQRQAGMTILEDLAKAPTDAFEKRAEDFKTFNIFIEYNGSIHKILKECTLTGHSHVLSQSGQVVKEFYNFFCKTVV